jgi:hypothetical protein
MLNENAKKLQDVIFHVVSDACFASGIEFLGREVFSIAQQAEIAAMRTMQEIYICNKPDTEI